MWFIERKYSKFKRWRTIRKMFRYAKQKRDNPTRGEALAWELITSNSIGNYMWRRQYVPDELWRRIQTICPFYILDFYCPDLKLNVEIDGATHKGREATDRHRDYNLKKFGITTLRFPDYVLFENPTHFVSQTKHIMRTLGGKV